MINIYFIFIFLSFISKISNILNSPWDHIERPPKDHPNKTIPVEEWKWTDPNEYWFDYSTDSTYCCQEIEKFKYDNLCPIHITRLPKGVEYFDTLFYYDYQFYVGTECLRAYENLKDKYKCYFYANLAKCSPKNGTVLRHNNIKHYENAKQCIYDTILKPRCILSFPDEPSVKVYRNIPIIRACRYTNEKYVYGEQNKHSQAKDLFGTLDKFMASGSSLFAIMGMIFSTLIILLILCTKTLWTPYGYVCVVQAIADWLFLFEIGVWQAFADLGTKTTFGYLYADEYNFIFNPHEYPGRFGFAIAFFTYSTMRPITTTMRLIRAGNRFVALFFPLQFQNWITKKNTLKAALGSTFLILLVGSPLIFYTSWMETNLSIYLYYKEWKNKYTPVPFVGCTAIYGSFSNQPRPMWLSYSQADCSMGQYGELCRELDPCFKIYTAGLYYFEIVVTFLCFLIDLGAIIKMRQISNLKVSNSMSKTERKREWILLIQIFGSTTIYYIWDYFVNSSTKYAIGHALDEFMTLFLQWRLAIINSEETKTITDQDQDSHNSNTSTSSSSSVESFIISINSLMKKIQIRIMPESRN